LHFVSEAQTKDAYDLYYHIRNFGAGVHEIAAALKPLLSEPEAKKALEILRQDFTDHEGVGPVRVAQFLTGSRDDAVQADVLGFVRQLFYLCK
jgi:hypothetical protein